MAKEEVRDGFLGDLPEDLRTKIMAIHKMIVDACNSEIKRKLYDDIRNLPWAKEKLNEFLREPKDKDLCGSVRVYKKGKRYSCMIQITGHPMNSRNTEDEELFHGFIRNVHTAIKGKIRRQFDVTITCESEHGENFEGYDIWTKSKVAAELWEKFSDKKTKIDKEYKESANTSPISYLITEMNELPIGLQYKLKDYISNFLHNKYHPTHESHINNSIVIRCNGDSLYEGYVYIGTSDTDKESFRFLEEYAEAVHHDDPTKYVFVEEAEDKLDVYIGLEYTYTEKLYTYLTNTDPDQVYEVFDERSNGTLKHSFRLCVNAENGHMIQIVFDLDPSSIMKAGDHTNQNFRQFDKLLYLNKHITKVGSGDFSSIGTVQAIKDLDTGKSLQSADTVGIIGSDPNSIRFTVPHKYSDGSDKDFKEYPVAVREKIAAELNLKNSSKGVTRFTVGQKETRPSYKSTRAFSNAGALYSNQFTPIKGFDKPDKWQLRYNPYARGNLDVKKNSAYVNFSNMSVEKFIQWAKSNIGILQKAANSNSVPGSKRFTIEAAIESFKIIERRYRKNSAERNRNIISDRRYSALAKNIIDGINAAKSVVTESAETIEELDEFVYDDFEDDIVFEAANEPDNEPEYNTNMTPAVAKRTLGTAAASVIQTKKFNQYTADIFANIITKNLLGTWAKGYRKLSITLDPKLKGSMVEFKIPNLTLDFVSRFVDGREPINGFLHRIPEIKIKISEGAFATMKERDDAFNFFRAAVKYYDVGVIKYSDKICNEIMKLPADIKRLISSSKLSGLVTVPIQMLFSFDNVDMSTTTTFNISKEDIGAVTKFIRGIYSNYASPEKEKQKIISDLKNIVYHLKESCDIENNRATVLAFTEGVTDWYSGKYKSLMEKYRAEFEYSNIDFESMSKAHHELKVMYESTKMKKLKKIPRDLVAYITIETESIRDANDKMMIASYCLAKLEIVEWYIELLEVGSKKYIVPHSKPYLEGVRRQLLQCYDNIMRVKIIRPNERPLIDIPWPKGYEG